jgi:hypothetical protein
LCVFFFFFFFFFFFSFFSQKVRDRPEALAKLAPRPLGEELTRHWTVNNLRKELSKACEGVSNLPGHLFEMWLFSCNLDSSFQVQSSKLADFDMEEDKHMMQDVLIPRFFWFVLFFDVLMAKQKCRVGEQGVEKLVARVWSRVTKSFGFVGFFFKKKKNPRNSEEQANAVVEKFVPELKVSVRAMHVAMMKDASKRVEVETRLEPGRLLVSKVVLPLSPSYRAKLEALYRRFGSSNGEGFEAVLAIVLMRYDALKGSVYQAGLPPAVMEVLKKDFGVFMECFASPLNCYFPRYCSMFTDDFAFGSLGSFFQFRPLDGSFLVFPPLVSSVVIAAVRHMEDLLLSSNRALSFILVLHGNVADSSPTMQAGLTSSFFVHRQTFAPKEHALTDGQAFRKTTLLKLAVAATSFLFLQNAPGKKRWPPDDEGKLAKLAAAFAGRKDDPAPQPAVVPEPKVEDPVSSNWKSLKKKLKKENAKKKGTGKK